MENLIPDGFNGLVGDVPVNPYQQAYNDTCAIKSQQLILQDFGVAVSEDQLVQYSAERGWYSGNGTAMEDVGKILVDAGIPCTQTADANVYDLANELAQGHKVIVAVDSGELWDGGFLEWLKELFFGETPDHALIVAGIDMTDPENPMVILTDPGTGQPAQPYPLDRFMDAWGDSRNYMVSTDIPTPAAVNDFTAYGLDGMHLPEVAGVDYNSFRDFQSLSHLVDPSQLTDLNTAFHNFAMTPDTDFSTVVSDFGLQPLDFPVFTPDMPVFDPSAFDYGGLCDTSWMTMPDMSMPMPCGGMQPLDIIDGIDNVGNF